MVRSPVAGMSVVRPPSVSSPRVAFGGLAVLVTATIGLCTDVAPDGIAVAALPSALTVLLVTGLALIALECLLARAHERPSTGLHAGPWTGSWTRIGTKLIGMLAMGVVIAFGYWAFPEYRGPQFAPFFASLGLVMPFVVPVLVAYVAWVDGKMVDPHDSYWHMGRAVLRRGEGLDRKAVAQNALGWSIKAFFLPLMFVQLVGDLAFLMQVDASALTGFRDVFPVLYRSLFYVDVVIASIGYLLAMRVIDSHIRSSDATASGWVVALACYEPFWIVTGGRYLAYRSEYTWGMWLADSPMLYALWGTVILGLMMVYVGSTLQFGLRFSNLTHRGLITNGFYRWTKHPGYIAKNVSWWMISVPFLAQGDTEAVRLSALLLGVNLIYFLRAKTEERHLSNDPAYRQYAAWIDANGLFRFTRRLPLLRRPGEPLPVSAAGRH